MSLSTQRFFLSVIERRQLVFISLLFALLFPWVIAEKPSFYNAFYFSVMLSASGLLLFLFFSLERLRLFWIGSSAPQRHCFLIIVGFLIFMLAADWRGFISVDDIYNLTAVLRGEANGWTSLVYSLFTGAMLILSRGHPFTITLLNMLFALNLIALLISLGHWGLSKLSTWILIAAFLSPIGYLRVLIQNRDSAYTLMFLYLLFGLTSWSVHRLQPDRVRTWKVSPWELCLYFVILGNLRSETVVFVVLAPFIFYFFGGQSWKLAKRYGGATYAGFVLINLLAAALSATSLQPKYQATALLNPLSYIVKEKGIASLTENQLRALDGYLHTPDLITNYSQFDILPLHRGVIRESAGPEEFRAFRSAALEIFWQNPKLLIANRTAMFLAMTRISFRGMEMEDDIAQFHEIQTNPKPTIPLYLDGVEEISAFHKLHRKALAAYRNLSSDLLNLVSASCFVPILLLIFFAIRFRAWPEFAAVSILLLLRVTIFAVTTPAANIKYLATAWLGGWIMLALSGDKKRFDSGVA